MDRSVLYPSQIGLVPAHQPRRGCMAYLPWAASLNQEPDSGCKRQPAPPPAVLPGIRTRHRAGYDSVEKRRLCQQAMYVGVEHIPSLDTAFSAYHLQF